MSYIQSWKRHPNLILHLNGATFWVRWYFWLWWCCEVRSGFLPSTQEGLFRVVPATFPGKHEHLTVWERSSIRFLLQHRCAAMTSHVPPSVDAETHTRTSVAHMRYITFDTVKMHIFEEIPISAMHTWVTSKSVTSGVNRGRHETWMQSVRFVWFEPSTSPKIWLWQNLSSKYSNYSHTYLRILVIYIFM